MHVRDHQDGKLVEEVVCGESNQSDCSKSGHCCKEAQVEFDQDSQSNKTPSTAVCNVFSHRSHLIHQLNHSEIRRSGTLDVEKNEILPEHVVLKFRGPDCAGCANKIFRVLSSFPALRGLRTNPILLQAEFDVVTKLQPISDIIESVRKATGYTGERVVKKWQEIEAIVPDGLDQRIAKGFPIGVKDVVRIDKNTVSIQYDAEIIGARDLLKTGFGTPLCLAPARAHDETTGQIRKTALLTFLSSILTIPILILSWAPLPGHETTYGVVSLILATMIQVVVAGSFYPNAFRSLFYARTMTMGLLVVLSTSTAYLVSVISFIYLTMGIGLSINVHFETSALLVTLIMVGRLLTAYGCQQAMKSASVRSLQPTTAFVINANGSSKSIEFDTRLLQYGDVFKVEPESPIVSDGIVISDLSYVDESLMTGESRSLEKKCGSSVIAGSINCSGTLLVQLVRLPGSNTVDEIANMVDEVNFSKSKIQEVADKFAGYFVPAIGMVALTTLCVWLAVGISIRHDSARTAILTALSYAISVLVVSCPCAIGLAVPMVMIIASGIVAKRGVVIKSASALQLSRNVTHVVFDKTGTLTDSQLEISIEKYMGEPPSFTTSLILGLTAESQHPVASTVAKHVGTTGFEPAMVEHVTTIVGKGIVGIFNGEKIRIGNAGWVGACAESNPTVKSLLSQGCTVSCVTKGSELLAVFGLAAALHKNANMVVSELLRRNIEVSIVSGDDIGAVHQAAKSLDIPLQNAKSRCSPLEKQQYVKILMQNPKNTVLFCGDGTNDAAALAQAHVGVYISSSCGVAQTAADVVLMRSSLIGILTLLDLSRDASRRVIFNFAWSAIYNVVAILFAAGALVKVRLLPEYAGLGEAISVLPVVLVALLMRWRK